jgi:AcrR family transcriptional regulator
VAPVATAKWTTVATMPRTRRTPVQRRSRERFERILTAAEQLVVSSGVESLTTRGVAERAGIPVATLYQYFADREAIVAALIERHVLSMDERIAAALQGLASYSVRSIVQTTVAAYRADYRQRPSYVVLWFQGRLSADIARFIRDRNELLADAFHRFATQRGLLRPDTDPIVIRLCFELADRFLEVAYRKDLAGDDRVVSEGVEMIIAHLERYATPAGIAGIDATTASERWGLQ